MAADLRSIAALREWLAALKTYQGECEESLFGIAQEIRRATDWVAEQAHLWKQAARHCEEAVVQARAELAARRFPGHDGRLPDTTLQERNLRRAQVRLDHCHERIRTCQTWQGQLPKIIEETYLGKAHRLGLFLGDDLEKAGAALSAQLTSLERYLDAEAPQSGGGG